MANTSTHHSKSIDNPSRLNPESGILFLQSLSKIKIAGIPISSCNRTCRKKMSEKFFHARLLALTGYQQIQISIFQIETLTQIKIGKCSFEKINTAAQMYLCQTSFSNPPSSPASSNNGINTLLIACEAVLAKPEGILGTQ